MERQKLVILPKLNRCNGDLSRQWFIYFSCRNPKTGKMKRFRIYTGFSDINNLEHRIAHGEDLCQLYAHRLRSGWTPFTSDEFIYDDHVEYKSVAEIYGTRRRNNNTVRMWISKFFEQLQPGISPATYSTYVSKLRLFTLWIEKNNLQDNDLATFSNQIILDFFNFLITKRELSGISIKKYNQILTSFFEFLKKNHIIFQNPVFDIPKCNRINDQAPRPIPREDIEIFKMEIRKDPELWLAVQFEFYCALRPGYEIRLMKIKDIDFTRGTVRVDRRRAKTRIERIVTIPQQFLNEIKTFYELQKYDKEFYVFGKGGQPGPRQLGKNNMRYRFNRIRARLNMPLEYKYYSWKHTGAVEAEDALIPIKTISSHLGHNSLRSTDFYFRNKRATTSDAIKYNYPDL